MLRYRRHGCSLVGLIGSLSLLSLLVGCHGSAERAEIRIGLLVDRTDPADVATVDAACLAVSAVNDAGGLDVGSEKHHIVLLTEDMKTTPGEAVDAARRLIHQQGVVALVGPSKSHFAIPVANVAENARVPMISPVSTNPQTTAGKLFVFRVAFLDSFQGQVLARFALEEIRTPTAAVLYDVANTYSRDIATIFQQTFEAAGGQVIAFESYTTGDQDFRPQLQRIRDTGSPVLFLPNFTPDVAVQVRQARQLGLDATFLGSDGWIPDMLTDHPEVEGAFVAHHWHLDVADTNPEARGFIAAYRQANDHDPTPSAALTYDAFGVLFQAIRHAKRAVPELIRDALSRIENYQGVTGAITFRGAGGDPQKPIVMVQLKGGHMRFDKLVSPEPRR